MEGLSVVATENPPVPEGRLTKPSERPPAASPETAYETVAPLMYGILRFFMPEDSSMETMHRVAQGLVTALPESGYRKYAPLVCLRILYRELLEGDVARVPRNLPAVSREETFVLLLRDAYGFSCADVAAVTSLSEGSIRTRLERARARAAAVLEGEKPAGVRTASEHAPRRGGNSDGMTHACIRARTLIEDWNLPDATMGQYSIPASVNREASGCKDCEDVISHRLLLAERLREAREYLIPESLRKIPISPLLMKEGRRWVLNWASAPWYFKVLFEGFLAASLILGVVFSIPRIKQVYEFWLERRLDIYSATELAGVPENPALSDSANGAGLVQAPVSTSATASSAHEATTNPVPETEVRPETEFIGRESERPTSDRVYRVLIKSDSPETIKANVLSALASADYQPADRDTPSGSELPGGIMFDVFIPLKNYKSFVSGLSRLGETKIIITRAKERGIQGKARLKIWLQRI